ncbi:MAG: MinD/ParA family protein [Deltaproteobacteria bacterium]|nr:MinD/ParA family protein [Deltaproteobacteria bacterium]
MEGDQAAQLRHLKNGGDARDSMTKGTDRSGFHCDQRDSSIRVIAITSGKGGVGKTNITANLGYFLSKMKKRIMIIDADMGLANIDLILGLTPKYNLYHVLKGERTIADTLMVGPGGIKILPSASGIQEITELSKGQKLALLDELNAVNENLDFVLIDTGAGIAGNVMYFNMAAKEIIVVTSPEPTSLTDAYALIKILYRRYARKRFRILVNMVKDPAEGKEIFKRLSHATDHFLNITIEYLGYILYDDKLPEAVKRQKALAELHPYAPASKCMASLAEKLGMEDMPVQDEQGSIKFFWDNIINTNHG